MCLQVFYCIRLDDQTFHFIIQPHIVFMLADVIFSHHGRLLGAFFTSVKE